MKKQNNKIKKWFSEGYYLDLWSILHFISGFILAGFFIYLKFNFVQTFILSLIVILGWEVYEYSASIKEHIPNRILDIILGSLGVVITFIAYNLLPSKTNTILYITLVIFFVVFDLAGWINYLKRNNY